MQTFNNIPPDADFGTLVRRTRENRGISMKDLAECLGVSVVRVSDMELGHIPPPAPDMVKKIAEMLDLDYDRLARLASQGRGHILIDVADKDSPKARVALALENADISREQADAILAVLNSNPTD